MPEPAQIVRDSGEISRVRNRADRPSADPARRADSHARDSDAHAARTSQYIRSAGAATPGYVFYVEPGPLPGQSIAYFGPDVRMPVPQPALNINMDADTNVESMTFSLDGLAKKDHHLHHPGPDHEQDPDSDPGAEHQHSTAAAGSAAHAAVEDRVRQRRRRAKSYEGRTKDSGDDVQRIGRITVSRDAGRGALWPGVAVANAGGRARRRNCIRRSVLCQQRHAQHEARRIQAEIFN